MLTLDQKYLKTLIESSPDIIIAVDRDGTIIYYNDGARQTLRQGKGLCEFVVREPAAFVYRERANLGDDCQAATKTGTTYFEKGKKDAAESGLAR